MNSRCSTLSSPSSSLLQPALLDVPVNSRQAYRAYRHASRGYRLEQRRSLQQQLRETHARASERHCIVPHLVVGAWRDYRLRRYPHPPADRLAGLRVVYTHAHSIADLHIRRPFVRRSVVRRAPDDMVPRDTARLV